METLPKHLIRWMLEHFALEQRDVRAFASTCSAMRRVVAESPTLMARLKLVLWRLEFLEAAPENLEDSVGSSTDSASSRDAPAPSEEPAHAGPSPPLAPNASGGAPAGLPPPLDPRARCCAPAGVLALSSKRTSTAAAVHLKLRCRGALAEYFCVGLVDSPDAHNSCNDFALSMYPDGDVWQDGAHAKYEGGWPNPCAYKNGDVLSIVVLCKSLKPSEMSTYDQVPRIGAKTQVCVLFYRNGALQHRPFLVWVHPEQLAIGYCASGTVRLENSCALLLVSDLHSRPASWWSPFRFPLMRTSLSQCFVTSCTAHRRIWNAIQCLRRCSARQEVTNAFWHEEPFIHRTHTHTHTHKHVSMHSTAVLATMLRTHQYVHARRKIEIHARAKVGKPSSHPLVARVVNLSRQCG